MILRYVHITEIHNICFLKKFKDFTAFIFTYVSHIFKVQEKNYYSQKRKLHIFKPTKCNDYFSFVIRLLQFSRLISVIFCLIYFQDCLLAYYIFLVFFSRRKKSWLMFFLIWLYFGSKLPNLYLVNLDLVNLDLVNLDLVNLDLVNLDLVKCLI